MLLLASERVLDRPGEIAVAAATILALVAVLAAFAPILRARERGTVRSRLTPTLVILTGGAAITFAAYLAFQLRCGHSGCKKGAGGGFAGLDRWWRSASSWQWGAQLLVASLGLVAAAVAFWLSAHGSKRVRPPLWAARLLYLGWATLVFLMPAAYELATG